MKSTHDLWLANPLTSQFQLIQAQYIKESIAGPGVELNKFDIYDGCECESACEKLNSDCACLARTGSESLSYVQGTSKLNPAMLSTTITECQAQQYGGMKPTKRRRVESTEGENARVAMPIFECNKKCKCPASCPTRVVQRGITVKLEARKFDDKGWGVIALQQIERLSFVCEYVGEILSTAEAQRRWRSNYDPNHLNYLLVVKEFMYTLSSYFLSLLVYFALNPFTTYTTQSSKRKSSKD